MYITSIIWRIVINSNLDVVLLNVYDINGKQINTLYSGLKPAGIYSVDWDADGYPSGVYFVKLDAGEFTQTQKLMLVK